MTVYVDNMEAAFGRMKMCHCWADTRPELFAMMKQIGIQLKWFQRPAYVEEIGMLASWEHFDISMTKRKLAVANGAVEVCMFTMAEHANRQRFIHAIDNHAFKHAAGYLEMMCSAAEARMRRQ